MVKIPGIGAEELNGFLDRGTELRGELRFQNSFRIDGQIKGKIFSDNTLIVGESGEVEADIDCGVVSIQGTVQGHIQGREKIELLAGSRVRGTLVSPRLLIEDGAFFQGECETVSPEQAREKPAAAAPLKPTRSPAIR